MAADTPPPADFEQALAELEVIVKKLESGDLKLDEALQLFERGILLRDRCQQDLTAAETRIETLVRRGSGFQAVPLDDDDR